MKQRATVVSADGKRATIKVDRTTMCDGCHKSNCGDSCAMYKIFGASTSFSADAVNEAGASSGDIVEVEVSDGQVNLNAFIVFIVPIIIAALVYLLTSRMASEGVRILLCVLSFFLFFAVLALTEKARKNKAPLITVSKIIERADKSAKL